MEHKKDTTSQLLPPFSDCKKKCKLVECHMEHFVWVRNSLILLHKANIKSFLKERWTGMANFLVAIKKKYGLSSNTHVL